MEQSKQMKEKEKAVNINLLESCSLASQVGTHPCDAQRPPNMAVVPPPPPIEYRPIQLCQFTVSLCSYGEMHLVCMCFFSFQIFKILAEPVIVAARTSLVGSTKDRLLLVIFLNWCFLTLE